MQKKDDKVDNKTACKEDRQREKKRARDKYGSKFAKKVHSPKSKYWLVCMSGKQKNLCNRPLPSSKTPHFQNMRSSAQPFL